MKRILTIVLSILLSASLLVPAAPELSFAAEQEHSWAEDIPAMLAAGAYEEGVVVVGMDGSTSGKKGAGRDLLGEAENIMTVDAASVGSTASTASGARGEQTTAGGSSSEGFVRKKQASRGADVQIAVIRQEGRTTEELLNDLAGNPRVVFAEPDYKITTTGDASHGKIEGTPVPRKSTGASQIADLAKFQWGNAAGTSFHGDSGNSDVSMHVPGFGKAGSNMDGDPITVAVLDSAVDFRHPDLADRAYTFTAEQQKALGCDAHGFNACYQSPDGALDYSGGSHGSHCAGILGANWDGQGISGVASNARIVSVQIIGEEQYTSLVDALRGYAFVQRANSEANAGIRITSNSWGEFQSSRALHAAVAELGSTQGVISIFSAGNDARSLEQIEFTSGTLASNPYAIIVAATDKEGNLSSYSNYGKQSVTLGAPGSEILSCVLTDSPSYFPEADLSRKFYEGFEDKDREYPVKQLFHNEETWLKTRTVSGDRELGFADDRVLKVEVDSDKPETESGEYRCYRIGFDLAMQGVEAGDYVGFAFAGDEFTFMYNEGSNTSVTINSVPVHLTGGKDVGAYAKEWNAVSFQIPENVDPSEAHLELEIYLREGGSTLYFDSLGAGTQLTSYSFYNGTSMATPAVSGGAAVLAAKYRDVTGEKLASLVRASVRSFSSLKEETVTGGLFDLSVDPTVGGSQSQGGHADDGTATGKIPLYEQECARFDVTGDAFLFDGPGDMEPSGPLVAMNGSLYYLPQMEQVEVNPGNKHMYSWDRKGTAWTELPALPVWLSDCSAAQWKGRLYVKGNAMELKGGMPYIKQEEPTVRCFCYDPQKKTWAEISAGAIAAEDTLVASEGGLLLVGGKQIRTFDASTGITGKYGTLSTSRSNPVAATKGDVVYVYDPFLYEFEVVKHGEQGKLLQGALPVYAGQEPCEESGAETDKSGMTMREAALAVSEEGIWLVGPMSEDGTADTYLLKEGATKFLPYEKRLAATKVNSVTAVVVDGWLYAMGACSLEANERVFRATRVTKPSPQSPEASVQPGTSPDKNNGTKAAGTKQKKSATKKNKATKKQAASNAKKVAKVGNPIKVTAKNKKYKRSKLKKKSRRFRAITVQKEKGKVTFKVSYKNKKSRKALRFYPKTGKVKVKKGTRKGTYTLTIRIRAAGNSKYKPATITKTIKVKVKK